MTHPTTDQMRAMFSSEQIAAQLQEPETALELYGDVVGLCFRYMEKGRLNKSDMVRLLTIARLSMSDLHKHVARIVGEQRIQEAVMAHQERMKAHLSVMEDDQDMIMQLREVAPLGTDQYGIPNWLNDAIPSEGELNATE